eukprot:CAMPEP_0119122230 /NCGR_PEP_ID=MMETSP1310-20130426/2552_1 /TAXON_ID=464262 /ORGANISM="Genus nov. species nov., Strain RCC2339" /LENGTH=67 /DNA_ID=CAMNT_0007111855 /DNA_START=31 /DNA_END=232 /DNA_ORIENTATION=+
MRENRESGGCRAGLGPGPLLRGALGFPGVLAALLHGGHDGFPLKALLAVPVGVALAVAVVPGPRTLP